MKAFLCITSLVAANFAYALFSHNYHAALERSFFQAVAVLVYALLFDE